MPHVPKPSPAASEDYLTTIYRFQERGRPVIAARIADTTGVTPATAFGMLKRLARDGLVQMAANKLLSLTDKGHAIAEHVVRRHRLAERLLTDVLQLEWHLVYEQAHLFEHAISEVVEQRLIEFLGDPATCPHGYPIPGRDGAQPRPALQELGSLPEGAEAVVARVPEDDPDLLRYLGAHGFVPGETIKISQVASFKGTITVVCPGCAEKELVIGHQVAATLLVTPL
ncbi:MAG: metal-dependent transcriptional regulator [Chloroflexi bacterium]|nr:metal-dependent transcriptional regulator [Chloroflexota bacterium]